MVISTHSFHKYYYITSYSIWTWYHCWLVSRFISLFWGFHIIVHVKARCSMSTYNRTITQKELQCLDNIWHFKLGNIGRYEVRQSLLLHIRNALVILLSPNKVLFVRTLLKNKHLNHFFVITFRVIVKYKTTKKPQSLSIYWWI